MSTVNSQGLAAALKKVPLWARVEREIFKSKRPAYLVGGLLRDLLLERERTGTLDLDVAVSEPPRALASRLARTLQGKFFILHESTQVYRIVLPKINCQVDIAALQGRDIEDDLKRRDFTVNALAWPIAAGTASLLDPVGGLNDLKRRILRAVSERALYEDPLRPLRAFRLAAQLDLSIDKTTLRWIRTHRKVVQKCAAERLRSELLGLFSVPALAPWLELTDEVGLLTVLFPELEACRSCAEEYYGPGGVLRHSLDTVARMDFLLNNLKRIYPALAPQIQKHPKAADSLLRLAALLHDIAKPVCAKRSEGRLRFFGHDLRGSQMGESILKRLRFSKNERKTLALLIAHHLRPGNLAGNESISPKATYRFFRDLGPGGVDLLLVCWADHASYLTPKALKRVLPWIQENPHQFKSAHIRPKEVRKTLRHLQVISWLLERYFHRPEISRPKRLLDGHAVMKTLNLKAGPKVGEVLKLLEEAQAEGQVQTRDHALRFIKSLR